MSLSPWKLTPRFLLRRAGFPFELLNEVAESNAATIATRLAEVVDRSEQLRRRLLQEVLPDEVRALAAREARSELKALSKWRKQLGKGHRVTSPGADSSGALLRGWQDLDAAQAEAEALRGRLTEALSEELLRSRSTLRGLFRDEALRGALFLLSPDLLEVSEKELDRDASPEPTSSERSLELRLYAFLQRFAAKNETTSYFGPLAYGRVEGDATSFGPTTAEGFLRREAFLAFWAAAALGRAAARDPALRPVLPVSRVPVARSDGERVHGPRGPIEAGPLAVRVFERADDALGVPELAKELGADAAEIEAEVSILERHGALRRDLEPCSTTAHPLDSILAQLPDVPAADRWRDVYAQMTAHLRAFEVPELGARRRALAEAERFFTEHTGKPARRAAGETYADRCILYEDCAGDLQPVRLSTAEAARLEASISPVLELGAAHGAIRHRAFRTLAGRVVADAGGKPMGFLEFAGQMAARDAELGPLLEPSRGLVRDLLALIERRSDGREARLEPGELAALLPDVTPGRFASPDVMIERTADGDHRYVLGEVHPYVFAWGSQNQFTPDREDLDAVFSADLSPWDGRERLAVVLRRRRHKGLVSDAFPGTFIEVTGKAVDDRERCIPVSELEVRPGPDGPVLVGPRGEVTLYAGEEDHAHLRVFAPPPVEIPRLRLERHTPRVVVGDFVVQRERWDIPEGGLSAVAEATTPTGLAEAVAAWRARDGLPRFVFVMSPTEPKPICLDFEAHMARSLLKRLASRGTLGVSEMRPGPEGLWVERSGRRHTSELRLAMTRQP